MVSHVKKNFLHQRLFCSFRKIKMPKVYNNHIDASVKEQPQTLLVPSEEIYKRVLCNKHI